MRRLVTTATLALALLGALALTAPAQANPYYTPAVVYTTPAPVFTYNFPNYTYAYYPPAYAGPRFYIPQYFSPSGSYYYTPVYSSYYRPAYSYTPNYYSYTPAYSYSYYYRPARIRR